jgi:ubiquinone/menaquinone biosynthesis C-methylase UbiE
LSDAGERYTEALQADKVEARRYYNASLHAKSEQHKQLESLLQESNLQPQRVADIACGGGSATFHLAALYPSAAFTLVDLNAEAIESARNATGHLRAQYLVASIYELPIEPDSVDLVICWQTLSWLEQPEQALRELIRICRPGGRIYASSLFNPDHDVDIYAKVWDHTRASAARGLAYSYNTYSLSSVRRWVAGGITDIRLHECRMPIDLTFEGRGLGTYTEVLQDGRRMQFSAGMLLNWGILELVK